MASCLFSDTRYSIGLVAGIPALMYVLQMLCKLQGKMQRKRNILRFFTLFQPENLVAGKSSALMGVTILLIGGIALFAAGIFLFCKKDLYI